MASESPASEQPGEQSSGGSVGQRGKVVGALVLGALGFVCLPVLGGLGAIALGLAARAELGRSPEDGRDLRLAKLAIALGVVELLVSCAALVAVLVVSSPSSTTPHRASVLRSPSAVSGPTASPRPSASETASEDHGTLTTWVGSVELVEVSPEVRSLADELTRQRVTAAERGQRLLIWLTVPDCPPCNGVAAALPDQRVQDALGRARLVRIDATVFAAELAELGLPLDAFPGFALLNTNNRPVDYLNGGEWDEDVPSRIAPVLARFLRGRLRRRQHPWHGEVRDDETPI